MSDFDPNDDLDTQERADAYVNWCAENFMRLSQGGPRTYRSATRCAAWLFVCASAQIHLDEETAGREYEVLLAQLTMYQALGRSIERQLDRYPIERLITLRSSLDCWEPVGDWAENLLAAAKCAVAAMLLMEVHPLIDLWEVECPDVWSLLDAGCAQLAEINVVDELEFADYAVRRSEMVTAKFTWQRANNLVRHVGMPPLSPN